MQNLLQSHQIKNEAMMKYEGYQSIQKVNKNPA